MRLINKRNKVVRAIPSLYYLFYLEEDIWLLLRALRAHDLIGNEDRAYAYNYYMRHRCPTLWF